MIREYLPQTGLRSQEKDAALKNNLSEGREEKSKVKNKNAKLKH
ncbi:MAG: hypothetical protein PHE61_03315 [Candidatus Omnitrophica bacterium]|nr:hypothetical protein [Candidatus Omnitrophota bacterium]